MLHSRDEEPTLAGLMDNAERFTSAYILPRDDERLYLELFAKGEYRPELLFGECDIARAAAGASVRNAPLELGGLILAQQINPLTQKTPIGEAGRCLSSYRSSLHF